MTISLLPSEELSGFIATRKQHIKLENTKMQYADKKTKIKKKENIWQKPAGMLIAVVAVTISCAIFFGLYQQYITEQGHVRRKYWKFVILFTVITIFILRQVFKNYGMSDGYLNEEEENGE